MFKRFGIGVRLWFGFGLILFLFAIVSLFIVHRMGVISNITNMMHAHPLTVNDAVLRIDANIVRMHRSMKDVVLAVTDSEIQEAIDVVNRYEKKVYRDFEIVAERFLGRREMYEETEEAFTQWKPIRDEVIALMQQGERSEAAAITKGKGAGHVEDLSLAMSTLSEFARAEAQAFLDGAREARARTLGIAYTLVIVTILAGAIFVAALTWSITRPLSQLHGAVLEISLGNLDKRVSVRTEDEIGQLARASNTMADKLRASYAGLEARVEQRTHELEEVNRNLERALAKHRVAEEELRMNAAALDTMLEGVNVVRARDQRFVYTNPAYDRMFGYENGELIGRPVTIINAPTDRSPSETAREVTSALNETGTWEGEIANMKKDGTVVFTHAKISTFEHSEHGALWIGVQEDITERKQKDARLRTSLEEKEVLLREVHHRTKNNMQVICSILSLQAGSTDNEDTKRAFQESRDRIQAMGLVHQKLYQSRDLSSIDLGEYIRELIALLLESHAVSEDRISVVFDLEPVSASVDTAIPCGLIINELVSNALKHAFPEDRIGEIRIRLSSTGEGQIDLSVSDNGVGVHDGFDFRKQDTLGLKSILMIGEHQLQGKVEFDAVNGVTCRIGFSDSLSGVTA